MQAQNREGGSRRAAPATRQVSPRARHRATLAAEALLDGEAEALTRKAVELALAGDGIALRAVTKTAAREERVDAMFPDLGLAGFGR